MSAPDATANSPAPAGSADLLEWAWGIIANASGGNWDLEQPAWQEAAARWRDSYFKTLPLPNAGINRSREAASG